MLFSGISMNGGWVAKHVHWINLRREHRELLLVCVYPSTKSTDRYTHAKLTFASICECVLMNEPVWTSLIGYRECTRPKIPPESRFCGKPQRCIFCAFCEETVPWYFWFCTHNYMCTLLPNRDSALLFYRSYFRLSPGRSPLQISHFPTQNRRQIVPSASAPHLSDGKTNTAKMADEKTADTT